jgi:hypothetical protein
VSSYAVKALYGVRIVTLVLLALGCIAAVQLRLLVIRLICVSITELREQVYTMPIVLYCCYLMNSNHVQTMVLARLKYDDVTKTWQAYVMADETSGEIYQML